MRPPRFWYEPLGLWGRVLSPLGAIWTAVTRRRLKRGQWERLGPKVICVGNLVTGGAGKTPVAIALLERLASRGVSTHALSRGYGGSLDGPIQVDPLRHRADEVGDEPLLLAAFAPTWIAKDRAAGARAAAAAGAEVIVLDDGFQNPSLAKDLSIIVVDAVKGFGNSQVMPAGPLREPLEDGLARADAMVLIGLNRHRAAFLIAKRAPIPVLNAELETLPTGMDWNGLRVVAFAGIAHPGKFFATVRSLGADIVAAHALEDHAPFGTAMLQRLAAEAKAAGAQLVTTEKDAVRLPESFRREVLVVPVRLVFEDETHLTALLDAALNG